MAFNALVLAMLTLSDLVGLGTVYLIVLANGIVTTDFGDLDDFGYAVALGTDGSIVAAGGRPDASTERIVTVRA